jgi:hypothetical protein
MNYHAQLIVTNESKPDNPDVVCLSNTFSLLEFEDKALLENREYENIFGRAFRQDGYKPQRRGIVRIASEGRVIYRMFRSGNTLGVKGGRVALTAGSLLILGINVARTESSSVSITAASPLFGKFLFYWNHPTHSVRLTYKLAIWGILVAVVLAVPTYVGLFQKLLNM